MNKLQVQRGQMNKVILESSGGISGVRHKEDYASEVTSLNKIHDMIHP